MEVSDCACTCREARIRGNGGVKTGRGGQTDQDAEGLEGYDLTTCYEDCYLILVSCNCVTFLSYLHTYLHFSCVVLGDGYMMYGRIRPLDVS